MALHVGIVGLPNVGKSTLFKALTKKSVDINNYPFCTIEPNVGIVKVPDARLDAVARMSSSKNVVPSVVEFVDIAGLVRGASEGEGLGNQFLATIREVDAIVEVVRVFGGDAITHVHDSVDPERDIEIIETELMLADMATVDKTLARLDKAARGGDKDATAQRALVEAVRAALHAGKPARTVPYDPAHEPSARIIREMCLLTSKPIIYVYNVSDTTAPLPPSLAARPHVVVDVKIEEELTAMTPEDAAELGMRSHLDELIVRSFDVLGLQTFLTTGEAESRSWTIRKDATAPEAGAAIHNDFKNRFIRADVVDWKALCDAGSWAAARERGAVRTVGKDYVMRDGDVVEFKIA